MSQTKSHQLLGLLDGRGRACAVHSEGGTNGLFAAAKGRGKPIVRTADESTPFIAREEFLMNRIVRRNGATPPWVELQGALQPMPHPFATQNGPREAAYHATALAEVNDRVRRYNALAPYAVRRPLYTLEAEFAGAACIGRGLGDVAQARATRRVNQSEQTPKTELSTHTCGWVVQRTRVAAPLVARTPRRTRTRTRAPNADASAERSVNQVVGLLLRHCRIEEFAGRGGGWFDEAAGSAGAAGRAEGR
ncbi:hypothetical protein GGX14DRAFT_542554 [Mycena pura]|uniref:DnaJ homologue subfamily C member 28 conserved domain-containing protein n=1 Tax=Mycena pura TaxID=153505 RepID=A0AAD6VH25_9AGAR|nr:hypothetical protein GGX14DRAFT_542554 [Mycena pura]